jgi:hypothetical protein
MKRGRSSSPKPESDLGTGAGVRRWKEPALSVTRWQELSLCAPAAIKDKFKGLAPRWKELALWWLTHALVGGVGRVIFEVSLPPVLRSARFGFSIDGVPLLMQLRAVCSVISKLACGPLLAVIGLKRACALGSPRAQLVGPSCPLRLHMSCTAVSRLQPGPAQTSCWRRGSRPRSTAQHGGSWARPPRRVASASRWS